MSECTIRSTVAIALATAALAVSGCTAPDDHDHATMASAVTFDDQWASSAETGMAAVFGTVTNNGHHAAHLVSGHSEAAGRVEIHEVVPDDTGSATMRPKAGGITVAPEDTHQLVPGGDHLMLMELRQPLLPGAEVTLTVVFEDGSELPVTAQVRDFAGGHEDYQAGTTDHG